MALLRLLLLVSAVLPLAQCYPFSPPTCYSKVLSMAREATQWASYLKRAYETVSTTSCSALNFKPSARVSFRFSRV